MPTFNELSPLQKRRRRILEEFTLDKIAAVDRPAQEGALAHIIKGAPDGAGEDEIAALESDIAKLTVQIEKMLGGMEDDDDMAKAKAKAKATADEEDDTGETDDGENDGEDTWSEAADRKKNKTLSKPVSKRHHFETIVDNVAQRDRVAKSAAMVTARRECPNLFAEYRGAPIEKSYDDLVEEQIAKGCSRVVAKQRVAALYPGVTASAIAKARDGASDFMKAVNDYQQEHGCSRTTAMSEIRKRDPEAYYRFQNS